MCLVYKVCMIIAPPIDSSKNSIYQPDRVKLGKYRVVCLSEDSHPSHFVDRINNITIMPN